MSILRPIAGLKTGTYTVTRTASGTYGTDGRLVAGSTSTLTIVAVVQPMDPREMKPLPEGIRSEEVKLLHTATQLRTRDSGGDADRIAIDGEAYTVFRVDGPWTLRTRTFYEVHAARSTRP